MQLTSTTGRSMTLWVESYQFPNIPDEEYDSNWVVIRINLEGFGQPWTTSDPALMTWELTLLAEWLEQILTGANAENEIAFIESSIRFQLIKKSDERLCIRVILNSECKPEWWDNEDAFAFELDVSETQIQDSIKSLRYQLERFPVRAVA